MYWFLILNLAQFWIWLGVRSSITSDDKVVQIFIYQKYEYEFLWINSGFYKLRSIFWKNYANFQKITAPRIIPKIIRDYFFMKLDGIDLWGKIVPSPAVVVLMGCNFFKKLLCFFRKFHILQVLKKLILSAVLLSNI